MFMVRMVFRGFILTIIATFALACIPPTDPSSQGSSEGSAKGKCHKDEFDVTLDARNPLHLPCTTLDKCTPDEIWKWFKDHHKYLRFTQPIYFDHLDKLPLAKVQLEHETLTIVAFKLHKIDPGIEAKRIRLSMNGLKGHPLTHDAIEVKVIQQKVLPFAINAHDDEIREKDDDGDTLDPDESTAVFDDDGEWKQHPDSDDHHDKDDRKPHKHHNPHHPHHHKIGEIHLVEITFKLEKFIFGSNRNAADLLREASAHSGTVVFKAKHQRGIFRTVSRTLRLQGHFPEVCPNPSPTPSPTATPLPTPIVHIDRTSVGNLTNVTSVQIDFSSNEPGTFQCSLDSSAFNACSSPFTQSGLADGAHHFSVEAINRQGSISLPAQFDWTVDTAAPMTTITSVSPSNNPTSQTQITFGFAANESATFECQLDQAPWTSCSSPDSFNALKDGTHTFGVRATDLAGNTGSAATYSWTVKTVPPTVQITSQSPSANPSNNISRTFTFVGSSDTKNFLCSLDTATSAACISPATIQSLTDGGHTFSVWGVDAAGNVSAPASVSFTIDTVAPTAIITSTVPSQSPTNIDTMTVSFSADESAIFGCSLDGGPTNACVSPASFAGLAEGTHIFSVIATDVAGNQSVPATYKWIVDKTPPVVTLVSVSPAPPVFNRSSITLNFAVNEPSTSVCALDTGTPVNCSSGSANFSSLTEGVHNISVIATDTAGNTAAPYTYSFTVDFTAPTVQITSVNPSQTLTNQTSITLSFSANEAATYQCSLDSSAYSACASPQTYSGLIDGSHLFSVIGVDTAGNVSTNPATYSWTVDTVPPVTHIVSVSPSESLTTATSVTFTFGSNETSTFDCSLDGATPVPCTSPYTYNGLSDGNHIFDVHATDLAGNRDSAGDHMTWTTAAQPLTITNFRVDNIDRTSAVVFWDTNLPSTSQAAVAVSGSTNYTFTAIDGTMTTSHSVTITGLTNNTLYNVFSISTAPGKQATSPSATFRTLR